MEISGILVVIIVVLSLLSHGIGYRRGLRVGFKQGRRYEHYEFSKMSLHDIQLRREESYSLSRFKE